MISLFLDTCSAKLIVGVYNGIDPIVLNIEENDNHLSERILPLIDNTLKQANKKILDEVKKITHKDMMTILKEIDQEFLYQTVNRNQFKKYFFENAEDGEIKEYIRKILQK